MDVRISLRDLEMTLCAVEEAGREGRGALERTATAFGVRRAVVMAAVNRVEAAFGGRPFFAVQVRRSGELAEAGIAFRRGGPELVRAWSALRPTSVDDNR